MHFMVSYTLPTVHIYSKMSGLSHFHFGVLRVSNARYYLEVCKVFLIIGFCLPYTLNTIIHLMESFVNPINDYSFDIHLTNNLYTCTNIQ